MFMFVDTSNNDNQCVYLIWTKHDSNINTLLKIQMFFLPFCEMFYKILYTICLSVTAMKLDDIYMFGIL